MLRLQKKQVLQPIQAIAPACTPLITHNLYLNGKLEYKKIIKIISNQYIKAYIEYNIPKNNDIKVKWKQL